MKNLGSAGFYHWKDDLELELADQVFRHTGGRLDLAVSGEEFEEMRSRLAGSWDFSVVGLGADGYVLSARRAGSGGAS